MRPFPCEFSRQGASSDSTGEARNFRQRGLIRRGRALLGFGALAFWVLSVWSFNRDGSTDIVWQNRETGEIAVWWMDQTVFRNAVWIANDLDTNWHAAAVADFNRDEHPDLLWRNPLTGENAIWLMNGTNRLESVPLHEGSTNYHLVGAADFNADGHQDLLWRHRTRDETAVWWMRGATWTTNVAWFPPMGSAHWLLAATGDCNGDGFPDLFWRHSESGSNLVWFLEGTNLLARADLRVETDRQFHLAATGSFNRLGHLDMIWRHHNGVNLIWEMRGTNFLQSTSLPTETNTQWRIVGTAGGRPPLALSAQFREEPLRLNLGWRGERKAASQVQRRESPEGAWTTLKPDHSALQFLDTNVVQGKTYEYRIDEQAIQAAVAAPPIEQRGTIILILEQSLESSLERELDQLRNDLAGDGWRLIEKKAPRHNDLKWSVNTNEIASIRSFVQQVYQSDPAQTKAVLLLGHVPVPYSGFHNPDGHGGRCLPADGFYGDIDGIYTDRVINFRSFVDGAYEFRHENRPFDGKWDQQTYPPNAQGEARVELAVGRVDFANMPVFAPKKEVDLLRAYLNKNHEYRHKKWTVPGRLIVGCFFPGNQINPDLYNQASRHASRWFGLEAAGLIEGDMFEPGLAALWAFHGGWGLPYRIQRSAGAHCESKDLSASNLEPRVPFASFYASYMLDWAYTNNFMRAFLASPNGGLGAHWFQPHSPGGQRLNFENLGLGESIGSGWVRSVNENPDESGNRTYFTWLGDPTLRLQVVAPPSQLSATGGTPVTLKWHASTDPDARYFVYRSESGRRGPWTRLTPHATVELSYQDNAPATGQKYYQVRALKLEQTGSGSFTNLSQGVFIQTPPQDE